MPGHGGHIVYRAGRYAGLVEPGQRLGLRVEAKPLFDNPLQFVAILQTIGIRPEPRVVRQPRHLQHRRAEPPPLALILHREDHRAIGARIRAIGHDHIVPDPHARGDLSGAIPGIEGRHRPLSQAFQHGNVYPLSASGAPAVDQRGQDGGVGVQAGSDIGNRDSHFGGSVGAAGEAHYAGLRLHQHVVGFLLAVGAVGSVARDAAPDEARVGLAKLLVPQAQPLDCAGHQVVEEDVGARHQAGEYVEVARLFEVEHDAALAPVEPGEVGRHAVEGAVIAARQVAAIRTFHFDHVRAHIGKLPRAEGRGHGLLQRHYPNAGQGKCGCLIHVSNIPAARRNVP